MLAKVFVYASLVATCVLGAGPSAAATATPSTPSLVPVNITSVSNPFEICTLRGIDIRGPIPSDAEPIEGGFSFSADSDAAHWTRAQIALASSSDIKQRDFANIGIGMFAQNWCTGQGAWFDNVQYDVQHAAHLFLYSVGISYRGIRNNEHLDFSRLSNGDWCGQYRYSAGPNTQVGCFNSEAITCFRLWHT